MPHAVPGFVIIVRTAFGGAPTTKMAQPQAESYLRNVVVTAGLFSKLTQALNDVFFGRGKTTGAYIYNNHPVYHASAGDGQASVTLFYYLDGAVATIFAMGEHVDAKSGTAYKITHFGPPGTLFAVGKTIALR